MIDEKRFYYNTWFEGDKVINYEIIDRESYPNYPNHNEKNDVPKWYVYINENDSDWQDMIVDLLNQLNNENEQLKERIKVLEDTIDGLSGTVAHMIDIGDVV